DDPDDIDAVLRGGSGQEQMTQADVIRATQPFDYPYSHYVDTWLPPLMAIVAGGVIVGQTLGAAHQGRVWVPILRLVLVLGLYMAIVFPLSHQGVKRGVRKLGMHMPWSALWKSFAIFTVPYALAYLLWLSGGSVASLALGCVVGLVVGLPVL